MNRFSGFLLLSLMLVALLLLPAVEALSYSISFTYVSGNFTTKEITLSSAASPQISLGNMYTLRLVSFQQKVLYETTFNVATDALFSIPLSKSTQSVQQSIKKTSFGIVLPYFANAKTVQILKKDNLLLTVDLSGFSTCNENKICDGSESLQTCAADCTCGNGFCEENYLSCSKDCSSGEQDGVCDTVSDGKCDLDCGSSEDIDCVATSHALVNFNYLYIAAGLVFFTILVIVIVRKFFWFKEKGGISRKKR